MLILSAVALWANGEEHITIQPDAGVTVRIYDDRYVVSLSPSDHIIELDTVNGEEFSIVRYYDDIYSNQEGIGTPELPYYSLELQLPTGADSVSISYFTEERTTESLPSYYLPSQNPVEVFSYDREETMFDDEFYSSWVDFEEAQVCSLSEIYNYMGSTGVSLIINPLLYDPSSNNVLIYNYIEVEIKVPDASLLNMYYEYTIALDYYYDDALNFYDIYKNVPREAPASNKGNYVILASKYGIEEIEYFANHKRDYGYDVTIYTLEDDVDTDGDEWTDQTEIRSFLYNLYQDERTRPRFVLLVGDISQIPFSDGQYEVENDPPTDIYYACLEQANIEKEKDLHPDVHVGRWPIRNEDAQDIINKTIEKETKQPSQNKISLFSGTGNGERRFYKTNKWVVDKVLKKNGYNYVNFNGRDGFDAQHLIDEVQDIWMFVFRGHANQSTIGFGGGLSANSIKDMSAHFGFGFACSLNQPNWSFGAEWLYERNGGGVGFYGATTTSLRSSNNKLEKQVFKMLENKYNMTIAQMVYGGASKYYNKFSISPLKKKQIKKYVLYGDPSLYIKGLNSDGDIIPMDIKNSRRNDKDSYSIDKNIEISNCCIYDALGQLVFKSSTADYIPLGDGIYIRVLQYEDGTTTSNKIIKQGGDVYEAN